MTEPKPFSDYEDCYMKVVNYNLKTLNSFPEKDHNDSKLVFDNQWNGVTFDPEISSNENFSSSSIFAANFNFGVLLDVEIWGL